MEVKDLLGGATRNLSVERAYGPAYEKDGQLIIPVALVAGGGGAGSGSNTPAGGNNEGDAATSDGEGGGFGGVILPVGVYTSRDGEVRFVPAFNVTLLVLALLGTVRVLARLRARSRHRDPRP